MYRIFIVDDEPIVREGLRCSIEWEEIGFTVVGEAENGAEALKKIERARPDVVITDMRMDIMDGTELIDRLRRMNSEIQLVIMTAYNEFTYAKAGIDNNVFAYITKPATNREIVSVFCRLHDKISRERSVQEDLRSYRADELLSRILSAPDSDPAGLTDLQRYLPGVTGEKPCFLALMSCEGNSAANSAPLSAVLHEMLDQYVLLTPEILSKCRMSAATVALLFLESGRERRLDQLRGFCASFAEKAGADLSVGVSEAFASLSGLPSAYRQAQEALKCRPQGGGMITEYDQALCRQDGTPTLSLGDIQQIADSLLDGSREGYTEPVQAYFHMLSRMNPDFAVVRKSIAEMITAVTGKIWESAYTRQLIFGEAFNPAASLEPLGTLSGISDYTLDLMNKLATSVRYMKPALLPGSRYSSIVGRTLAYISNNYARNLKIRDIAGKLRISESRLIHLFKEETGKTINEYLTEYRIRLAEVLIHISTFRLYEISDLVGYQNPITFRKAFAKVTGSVPSRYQQQGESDELS